MRARVFIGVVAAVAVAGSAVATTAAAAPDHRPTYVKEPVATGSGGAVASAEFNASKAGIDTLRAGGNAIDAAVAAASTLGVTEPFVAGPAAAASW